MFQKLTTSASQATCTGTRGEDLNLAERQLTGRERYLDNDVATDDWLRFTRDHQSVTEHVRIDDAVEAGAEFVVLYRRRYEVRRSVRHADDEVAKRCR